MTMQDTRTEAPARPSYLGLLNAISAAEGHGYGYLTAWADMTSEPAVEAAVRFVAAREGEHSFSFARRIVELGFRPRPRPMSEKDQAYSDVARSDRTDLEKLRLLDYAGGRDHTKPDVHDNYFHDHTIDPATGALLGRFVAEERDSVRVFERCYQELLSRS
jgi:hypothetical protein